MSCAHLTLPNGLHVTLRHAPRLKRCAAAVRVRAGSHDAPNAWPGLAHFLEHLFFLGNPRFAIDDALMRYVQRQGGQVNASTRERTTDFFFEVPAAAFEGGIERLCEMLANPQADRAQQLREREVIHAEFIAWARNPEAQRQHALLQSVSAQHPLSGFHAGNRYSLPVPDAAFQSALQAFHQRYYQAGQMTLSLVGPQPLATLEALAMQYGAVFAPGQPIEQGPAPALQLRAARVEQLPGQRDVLLGYERLPAGAAQAIAFLDTWLSDTRPGGLLAALRERRWLEDFSFSALHQFAAQALLHARFKLNDAAPADQVEDLFRDWLSFLRDADLTALNSEYARIQQSRALAAGTLELARRDSSGQPFSALDAQGLAALQGLLEPFTEQARQPWRLPPAEPLLAVGFSDAPATPTPAGVIHSPALPAVRQYGVIYLRWQVRSALRARLWRVLEGALRPLVERATRASVELQWSECEHLWQLRCAGSPPAIVAVVEQALALLRLPAAQDWSAGSGTEPALIPIRLLLKQLPGYIVGRDPGPLPTCLIAQPELDALWQHARWQGMTCGFTEAVQPALNALLAQVPGQPGMAEPITGDATGPWQHVPLSEGEHALLVFCPAPPGSEAVYRLLAHRLQGPFYQRLRVELQLGYAVFSALRQVQGHTGLLLGVQSPKADPAQILEHMRCVVAGFTHDLTDDAEARQALAAQFHEPDMGNADVAEWAWQARLAGSDAPSLDTLRQQLLAVTAQQLEHAARHLFDNALYLASAAQGGLLPATQQPFSQV